MFIAIYIAFIVCCIISMITLKRAKNNLNESRQILRMCEKDVVGIYKKTYDILCEARKFVVDEESLKSINAVINHAYDLVIQAELKSMNIKVKKDGDGQGLLRVEAGS